MMSASYGSQKKKKKKKKPYGAYFMIIIFYYQTKMLIGFYYQVKIGFQMATLFTYFNFGTAGFGVFEKKNIESSN